MTKKDILIVALKVVIYACTLVLACLGVSAALTSCTVHRTLDSRGRAVIVTSDTTVVNHSGVINFKP